MTFPQRPTQTADEASRWNVAWVAGLSNPATCRLPAPRLAFLQSLCLPGWNVLPLNFPWTAALDLPAAPAGLLAASFQNTRQFLFDTFGLRRRQLREMWAPLLGVSDRLLIISISCGMQILLEAEVDRRANVAVIGLGPVGWRRPECPHLILQGEHDFLSRIFYRRPDVRIAGQGHMHYDQHADTLTAVNSWICNNISKLAEREPIFRSKR